MKTWFKVLDHFERNAYFTNGLTIPFLIGTYSLIDPAEEKLNVEDFFEQIMDESLSRKISIQRCPGLREYVIGIFDDESAGYTYRGKPVYRQFGNLFLTDESFSEMNDSEEIKEVLVQEYQNLINSNYKSKNNGEWGNYSEREEFRIKELSTGIKGAISVASGTYQND